MTTAQDVFDRSVRMLPIHERLRLAALILQDLLEAETRVMALDPVWSEQDQRDLTAFSLRYAEYSYPDDASSY
jgi:Mg2+/citrate symporter